MCYAKCHYFYLKKLLYLLNSILLTISKRDTFRPIHLSSFGGNTLVEAIAILDIGAKITINSPIGMNWKFAGKQSTRTTLIV